MIIAVVSSRSETDAFMTHLRYVVFVSMSNSMSLRFYVHTQNLQKGWTD